MSFTVKSDQNRFEYAQDGHTAFALYRQQENTIYIDHVEAPPALRGTGAAGKLMEKITEYAMEHSLKITPICGYAAAWIRKHRL